MSFWWLKAGRKGMSLSRQTTIKKFQPKQRKKNFKQNQMPFFS